MVTHFLVALANFPWGKKKPLPQDQFRGLEFHISETAFIVL